MPKQNLSLCCNRDRQRPVSNRKDSNSLAKLIPSKSSPSLVLIYHEFIRSYAFTKYREESHAMGADVPKFANSMAGHGIAFLVISTKISTLKNGSGSSSHQGASGPVIALVNV